MEELCNLRSKICILGFIDIILSTFGLSWLVYMYIFVVYDHGFKHYLGSDVDCLERIKDIELKELNHQYMMSLMIFSVSMIGYLILGFLLLIHLSLQDPTRYFSILSLVAQFPFLVLTIAGCAIFFSDDLCSLNSIPDRLNDSHRWPLQVIMLCITILFIGYKLYELWIIASIISQFSHKKAKNSVHPASETRLYETPMIIEGSETFFETEDEDDYEQDHAKREIVKGGRSMRFNANKQHYLPYNYQQQQPNSFNAPTNLQSHLPRPQRKDNGRNYIREYSDVPEDTRKHKFRKSIDRAQTAPTIPQSYIVHPYREDHDGNYITDTDCSDSEDDKEHTFRESIDRVQRKSL